jgi:hypothetical protein
MPTSRVSKIERGDGGVDLVGLVLLLILGIIISAGLGYAYFYVSSEFIHHFIVSPLLGGALVAICCGGAVYLATCRNIIIASLFGILVGLGVGGGYWIAKYIDYVSFRQAEITSYYGTTPPEIDAIINQELVSMTGEAGFTGFVKLLALQGLELEVPISRRGRVPVTVAPEHTYLVWGGEIVVIILLASLGGAGMASRPYSAQLKRWIHYKYIGQVSRRDINSFLHALHRNDPIDAGALVDTKNLKDEYPYLDVSVASDATKSTNGVVKAILHQLKSNGRGSDSKVVFDEEIENVLPIVNAGRRKKMPAYRGKYKF